MKSIPRILVLLPLMALSFCAASRIVFNSNEFAVVRIAAGLNAAEPDAAESGAAKPQAEATRAAEPTIDFGRDIRPILAQHCWSCHGPDETTREAGLRLDQREAAVATRPGSAPAIIPHQPATSQVVQRIRSRDPDQIMPPPSAKKPLSDQQRSLLERWIKSGAEYAGHWSFQTPIRHSLPAVRHPERLRGPIDSWIQANLERREIVPLGDAHPSTLARRAALDLTGLPLSDTLASEFCEVDDDTNNHSATVPEPDAYERLVDRLLASPQYAERMAMQWLDAARYADTNGYNNDEERTMWPWRDWVIQAFQRQMPFDQFLTEQLAGDLIPDATLAQRVATGFHRNHAATTEGGIIEEEYRVEYVAERVHTTSSVFLGLSLQCARCHDHKYDPLSQREYYQFFAFFNQLPHHGATAGRAGAAEPALKVPSADQQRQLDQLDARQRQLTNDLAALQQTVDERISNWEAKLTPAERDQLGPTNVLLHLPLDEREGNTAGDRAVTPPRALPIQGKADWTAGRLAGALKFDGQTYLNGGQLGNLAAERPFTISIWLKSANEATAAVLSKMDDAQAFRGYDITLEQGRIALHLIDRWPDDGLKVQTKDQLSMTDWHHLAITYDGGRRAAGIQLYWDGKPQPLEIVRDSLRGTLQTDKPFHLGRRQSSLPYRGDLDDLRIFGRVITADEARSLAAGQELAAPQSLLAIKPTERTPDQRAQLRRFYLDQIDPDTRRLQTELAELPKQREAVEKAIPLVMVMQDQATPRVTQILRRGQYDQPGDAVSAAVPAVFAALPKDRAANRLALARWLTATAPPHPLTARVAVNRWWESYFGLGLVETLEDFGLTGSFPSHPELLDWLAWRLLDTNWDTLRLQRELVTSSAYRRASTATPETLAVDPKNQWLARGPRYRLSAETVRDQALVVSGLLVERLGGPSVKPYQPDGLWEDVTVERRHKYEADLGAGLYRRSMYTFWKRTCPPPTMSAFDAPSRETCTIRRARTNTPLQALVLLNDPTYVEASRKLAELVLSAELVGERAAALADNRAAAPDEARVHWAGRRVLGRKLGDSETMVLLSLLRESRAVFAAELTRAEKLLGVGRATTDKKWSVGELAAWTIVCDTLLNLDEAITKP